MIAGVLGALMITAAQPGGATHPLVVELCNDTPARVAYSISYPVSPRSRRQRGWLTIEPGQCDGGSIGNTSGGIAYVHAMSGSYVWPSRETGTDICTPPNAHDGFASSPDCPGGQRQVSAREIFIEREQRHYTLNATVRCRDLANADAHLCVSARRDAQGFAETVRQLNVCNHSGEATQVIAIGQTPDQGWEVSQAQPIAAGACLTVWRGFTDRREVYLHAPVLDIAQRRSGASEFCINPEAGSAYRIDLATSDPCREDEAERTFERIQFGERVETFTYDLGSQRN